MQQTNGQRCCEAQIHHSPSPHITLSARMAKLSSHQLQLTAPQQEPVFPSSLYLLYFHLRRCSVPGIPALRFPLSSTGLGWHSKVLAPAANILFAPAAASSLPAILLAVSSASASPP